ncbi:MAG: NYN domain-containing protein [Anaerolineales bacterium]
MPFLIDGHNVIAALPDIDLDAPDDEAQLVLKLRSWVARQRTKAVVVFDGGLPGGFSRTLSGGGLEVTFAARHHSTADRVIRARLRRLPDAGNWTVVSSDREVLESAYAAGARTMSAQAFAARLERPRRPPPEKPPAPDEEEVEEWLAIFSERESQAEPRIGSLRRSMRTIAAQLGISLSGEERQSAPSEKPQDLSAAEVRAWLDVFREPEEPAPPQEPPSSPPPEKKRRRRPLTVDKEHPESLSPEEVALWESVFPEVRSSGPAPAKRPKRKKARRSKSLARHRRRQISSEERAKKDKEEGLTPEELEQWYRMFGEEPDK